MAQHRHPGLANRLTWRANAFTTNPAPKAIVDALNGTVIKQIATIWRDGYRGGDHDDTEVGRLLREQFERDQRWPLNIYADNNVIYFDDDGEEIEQPVIVALTAYDPGDPGTLDGFR